MKLKDRTPTPTSMEVDLRKNSLPLSHHVIPVYDADFEMAISSTEFGKFNFLLYLIGIPAAFTTQFEVTNMSYTFAPAQCDLNLSLENKGMLNAITYLGTVSSSFLGGFLADTFGRKKICGILFTIAGCNAVIYSFSQSYPVLLGLKYLGGVLVGGPYSALVSYISEFHDTKKRGKMSLLLGFFYAMANVTLPLLAWGILPLNIEIRLFNDYIVLHSWNFYLMACAVPGLLSGLLFCFLPESPKFFMSVGKNDKALKVFRTVYSWNTGLPKDSFPVQSLLDETKLNQSNVPEEANNHKWKDACKQMLSVFLPPYTLNLALVLTMQFGIMCGMNTLRLWLPELYAAINNFQAVNPSTTASLCTMLTYSSSISEAGQNATDKECVVELLDDVFYIRNIIAAATAMSAFVVAVLVINKVGKKPLFTCCGLVGGISGACMYFSVNTAMTVALAAINLAFSQVGILITLGITVDLFPTNMRTMTVALASSIGRLGSMAGNIIFPVLLLQGCFPPFIFVGTMIFMSAIVVNFLPKTDLTALR